MRTSFLRAWRWAPLLAILAATPAAAQRVNVEAEHERGLRLRDENHNEEALAVFQQIYERTREPRALARMALAEGALNRWADAEGHILEAIAARRDRWIRHNRAGLRQNLQVIRSHLGTVQVSCNVPGAQVVIRSGRPGTVPLPQVLRLSEGPNELEVFAEGYVAARQPITVVPGATLSVVVALAAEPPAPPPPPPPPEPAPEPPPPPPLVCPGAQVSNPQTLGHCCWPGQVYSTVAQSCTGSPQCPSGMIARGETCAEAPPPPPPQPVFVQRPDPEVPVPSTAPGQFMLALAGGGEFVGAFSPIVQGRLGFVLGGSFVLGFTGSYAWTSTNSNTVGGALEMGAEFGGKVVRVQLGVQTGFYIGGGTALYDASILDVPPAPTVLRMVPETTLLIFPTRSFYIGLQLQASIYLATLNDVADANRALVPRALLEFGLRL